MLTFLLATEIIGTEDGGRLSLDIVKDHLRVDHSDEDLLIAAYLRGAIAWVENYTGKLLSRRYVTKYPPCFGSRIELLAGPDPDDISISYLDPDGTRRTLVNADWRLIDDHVPYVLPAVNGQWPTTGMPSAITLRFVAGYGDDEVPDDLVQAVLLLVGYFYGHREASIESVIDGTQGVPAGVKALVYPYRVPVI